MPAIIQGNLQGQVKTDFKDTYDYDYPDELDLRPTSKLHKELVSRLLERARESATIMSARYKDWNNTDQFLTTYKPIDQDESDVQNLDARKPVSIVFPYTYAILETLMSYMVAAFFGDPIFRYEGYGPDDVIGSILLEQIISLHTSKFKVALNLHTMFRDSFAYGIAPVTATWKSTSNGKFSGNALENIDPYLYLPDPNVAAEQIQDGEYVGWIRHTNYMDLLTEEQESDDVFNVRYLSQISGKKTTIIIGDPSNRTLKSGIGESHNTNVINAVDELIMYIKLIPSEWGLGDSDVPEKWLFRLAGDQVIITARPAEFSHDKFPVTVCAPDFDGYSATPISRLEILSGLQGVLDFLFNSHIANVRKAINDMIIYDPFLVNSKDLKDPKPGKLIRMRRPAWGKGVKDAVQQLQVNDITRANMADSSFIVQWMQKIGATDDAAMGSLRQGGPERLTGAEFQGTQQGAVSRLERIAKVIGLQAMQDIGEFFAAHTIEMMSEDAYIRTSGDWIEVLKNEYGAEAQNRISRGRMRVSPYELDVNFDVIVKDGSVPGGNFSPVWLKMFEVLAANPALANSFDIVKIFKHIARSSGAKNVNDFVRSGGNIAPNIMPDAQVAAQAQQGNITPIGV